MEQAGHSIGCIGEQVIFECSGKEITIMRWSLEPFISDSTPLTFVARDKEGICKNKSDLEELQFCLTSIDSDGEFANMTSSLNFSAVEFIDDQKLDGTVVKCDGENTTL